jgi:hypothetical protein
MGHLGMIEPGEKPSRRAAWPGWSPERLVGSGMVLIGGCIMSLISDCLYRFPTLRAWSSDGLIAAAAGVLVAGSYGLIGWFGARSLERRKSRILRLSLPWAIAAGVLFGSSMLGEYLIPHDNDAGKVVALGVFGSFFALLFAAGVSGTLATGRVATGALAGFWTALIASELWVLFLLAIYLGFLGTPQEARFLEVDQVLADFERSGQPDLRAFIFGDYMGAVFFHSLLGAIFGLLLGGLGGWAALPLMHRKPSTQETDP